MNLHKWRICYFGKSSGNLCLPTTSRTNHKDVLWNYLFPERLRDAMTPPPVS